MSYRSIVRSTLTTLTHPTAIALFGSVGIHAALGVALPALPIFSQNSAIRRDVRVVELNAAEQGRLPDLEPPPPLPAAALPDSTQFFTLPELDSNPSPSSETIPQLPAREELKFPAYNSPAVSLPNNVITSQRGRQPTRWDVLQQNRPYRGRRNTVPTFSNGRNYQFPPINPNNLSAGELFRNSVGQPSQQQQPQQPSLHDRGQVAINPERNAQPGGGNSPHTNSQVAARSRHQQQVARIQRFRNQVRHDPRDTNPLETARNYVQWKNEIQNQQTQRRSLRGAYPRPACYSKLEGTAVFGVVVNGSGAIASVRRIKSAGYPILNQQARQQISGAGLGSAGQYYVTVSFSYNPEVCGTLAQRSQENSPPTPQREGSPQPSPAPKPQESSPPTPQREERPQPSPAPKPQESSPPPPQREESPQPAPAPKPQESSPPTPQREERPQPAPAPKPQENSTPTPQREESPQPTPAPKPQENSTPTPQREERPQPAPAPKPQESSPPPPQREERVQPPSPVKPEKKKPPAPPEVESSEASEES